MENEQKRSGHAAGCGGADGFAAAGGCIHAGRRQLVTNFVNWMTNRKNTPIPCIGVSLLL